MERLGNTSINKILLQRLHNWNQWDPADLPNDDICTIEFYGDGTTLCCKSNQLYTALL